MSKIVLQAPAKINLGLEILRKRTDGFHDIKTVFCSVNLFDEIKIVENLNNVIEIFCDDKEIPTDERNTVYKALKLLRIGATVNIKKRIPAKAGLGGGSSDAGVVIKHYGGGNGIEIGSDVPYAVVGGTKLGEGRGEILSELPSLGGINMVISVAGVGVDTKWAYENVDYEKIGKGCIEKLILATKSQNVFEIAKNLHNDFEYWVLPKYPEILEIKESMIKYGALGSLMTGSGSGVFGICEDEQTARTVYNSMKKLYRKTFLVKVI
jgi:4-diphosphocytidyl-2-C-methyl-D-erythritol kinase